MKLNTEHCFFKQTAKLMHGEASTFHTYLDISWFFFVSLIMVIASDVHLHWSLVVACTMQHKCADHM